MNTDYINKLNAILNRINSLDNDEDIQWLETLSGKIFTRLESIAKKEKESLSVENKGKALELFHVGNQTAHLSKRLSDSTVGEDGGTIQTFAECWEYKRLHWWREALDLEDKPVVFLDTPIMKLAEDANVSDAGAYFDPAIVVQKYNLNPTNDRDLEIAMQHWIKEQIKETLNPLLKPNYEVKEYENALRLCPMTDEAKQSRIIDNSAYEIAKKQLHLALNKLQSCFKSQKHSS